MPDEAGKLRHRRLIFVAKTILLNSHKYLTPQKIIINMPDVTLCGPIIKEIAV
jgi:hypothetical protein